MELTPKQIGYHMEFADVWNEKKKKASTFDHFINSYAVMYY